jgi:hypothetical protein
MNINKFIYLLIINKFIITLDRFEVGVYFIPNASLIIFVFAFLFTLFFN